MRQILMHLEYETEDGENEPQTVLTPPLDDVLIQKIVLDKSGAVPEELANFFQKVVELKLAENYPKGFTGKIGFSAGSIN